MTSAEDAVRLGLKLIFVTRKFKENDGVANVRPDPFLSGSLQYRAQLEACSNIVTTYITNTSDSSLKRDNVYFDLSRMYHPHCVI